MTCCLAFWFQRVLDPEFLFVLHLLVTVRRFVITLVRSRALDFFYLASHFLGSLRQVHGPAAALGLVLRNLGWQINADGVISVGTFLDFDFLSCSSARLRRFLELTWQYQLIQFSTSRWSWFEFPDISIQDTRQVLSFFQDPQRTLLIREIAGGYQLAGQKKHWLDSEDGTCKRCDQLDSRRHRLADCPLGADIREPFGDLFRFVEQSGSCMLDFPAICVHPDSEALRLLHFRFEFPTWSDEVVVALQTYVDSDCVPHFYTDGSC